MRILLALAVATALSLAAAPLFGAEAAFVTVDGAAVPALRLTNSAPANATAPLVYGALGSTPSSDWSGRVVVLDRGEISFAAKVKNVADAGGLAVVVVNNVDGPANSGTLEPATSAIPAVTVGKADGASLKLKLGKVARVGGVAPIPAIPDPSGHKGEFLASDGEKFIYARLDAPVVSTSSEVATGARIAFTVAAEGSPPFSYQWIKDGQNIAGATSPVLAIASAAAADAGSYVCQVTNDKGTAASAPNNLTVK